MNAKRILATTNYLVLVLGVLASVVLFSAVYVATPLLLTVAAIVVT